MGSVALLLSQVLCILSNALSSWLRFYGDMQSPSGVSYRGEGSGVCYAPALPRFSVLFRIRRPSLRILVLLRKVASDLL
ncbi:hypothetical protein BDM02DRAFT_3117692 [Thelephora ganbajun]|uniref:Uncharacterized protein n=1 Tax=Thelephora ganbajun TaxID=370292 RepID=A0ACB6ZBU8_THEGA|nr:hypothetical protein BDM02DRAFT_3117692 [Thelephora ganbajun]